MVFHVITMKPNYAMDLFFLTIIWRPVKMFVRKQGCIYDLINE